MNLLIFSQHFWPESFRINELAEELACRVENVYVLTGKPNYPEGKIFKGYQVNGIQVEKWGSIKIYRVPIILRSRGGMLRMIANYLSFIVATFFIGPILLRKNKIDIIFIYGTSPLIQGLSAIPLKLLFRAKLVTWVQDLWPEDLYSTGYITNKHILKINEFPVRILYYFTDLILVQSNAFYAPIKRLTSNKNIDYLPNAAEKKVFLKEKKIDLPEIFKTLKGKFNIIFAGNIGKNQSIDTIIKAAEILQNQDEIRIIMIGSGSYSRTLISKILEKKLKNIVVTGRFDAILMPVIYEFSDALLVTLGDATNLSWTVPSKVQTYMAAGRPIIGSVSGEAKRIIETSESGFVCESGDAFGLAECILKIYNMDEQTRCVMGKSGRSYAELNFHPDKIAEKLLGYFEK